MAAEQKIAQLVEVEKDNGRRPGRPRSDRARKAILDAARRLMTHMPMNELSIEAIAKKAKVGKTTIYRWWPSKAAVAMDAFLEQPGIKNIVPTTSTASEGLQRQIENMIRQLRGQNGRIIAGIIAEGQSDPEISELMYERFLKERLDVLYTKIEEGKASGELNTNITTDIAIDMIMGPLFLRVLSGEAAMDNDFAENFPQQMIVALSA